MNLSWSIASLKNIILFVGYFVTLLEKIIFSSYSCIQRIKRLYQYKPIRAICLFLLS